MKPTLKLKSNLDTEVKRAVDQKINNIYEKAAQYAKATVPVDTGVLRDSIGFTTNSLYANAPYASYVEFGSADRQAQPFLMPSIMRALAEEKR